MMNSKLFGGILLIAGTAIGAGMLALPVLTAQDGFITSIILLTICWLSVLLASFYMLEVCLWLPENTNLISMAKQTLGRFGEIIAWFFYLFLLYSVICAYIAGSADMLQVAFRFFHVVISSPVAISIIVLIFGYIAYRGIRSIDHVNRIFTIGIFIVFLILFFSTVSHVHPHFLFVKKYHFSIASLLIMVISFSFAIIVPSLRDYYHSDLKKIRWAILIGGSIPFLLYVAWIALVHGVLSEQTLLIIASSPQVNSSLTQALSEATHRLYITNLSSAFVVFAIFTSLLGVSLCITDFIQDGLKLNCSKRSKLISVGLSFIPPFIIVLAAPGLFIHAVEYAGLCCVVLLVWLPSLMAWRGRYHTALAKNANYQVLGGKWLVITEVLLSTMLIFWTIGFNLHLLPF